MSRGCIPWNLDPDDLPGIEPTAWSPRPQLPHPNRLPQSHAYNAVVWSSLPMHAPGHPTPADTPARSAA